MRAFAELSEDRKRIDVHFSYSPQAVAAIKFNDKDGSGVPGARFHDRHSGGPKWSIPLDLNSAQRLREAFGPGLQLGDALRAWGKDEVAKQRNLRSLTRAGDAELKRLPSANAALAEFISARPYQRADIAMMAETNVLNANQPGTGKTVETIGSWIESGLLEQGPHLVVAPVRSLINVWFEEMDRWIDLDIYTEEEPTERRQEVLAGLERAERGEPVVICVNPEMIRLKKIWTAKSKEGPPPKSAEARRDHKGNIYGFANEINERLLKVKWKSCTIDEFHKMGLSNRNSLLALGMAMIQAEKKAALSGTPIGGRPRKLWAILNWLEPQEYTSEWRWIDMWLETEEGYNKSKIVGDIQPGREDAFYEAHARHMVRRLKRDALPGLPPQVHILVKCRMTPKQKQQYEKFAADAEIRIDEERLSGNGILAEYTRLKQFANAAQRLDGGVPYPTPDSGKLAQLMQKLDEEGIRKLDPEPFARAIVASESSRMAEMVYEYLHEQGIAAGLLTGDTKDSQSLIKAFKDMKSTFGKEPYLLVMTTQTGGISLNLEEAGSIHTLDETWNPDDIEQLFDRGDRGSRTTPLRCYTYRTRDTIQEYIADINEGKKVTNRNILDIRRKMADN